VLGRGECAHGEALSRCPFADEKRLASNTSGTCSNPQRELPLTTGCCRDHDRGRFLTAQTKALGAQNTSGDRMKIENPARSSAPVAVPDLSPQQVAHPKGNPRPRSQAERHRGPADDCGTPLDRVHGPLLPCKPNAIRFGQVARVSGATKVSCNPFSQLIPTFHRPLSAPRGGDHTGGGPGAVFCSLASYSAEATAPRIVPVSPLVASACSTYRRCGRERQQSKGCRWRPVASLGSSANLRQCRTSRGPTVP